VAADYALSDVMMNVWTAFAKTGNPNVAELPRWRAFTATNENYMEFGDKLQTGSKLRMAQMRAIEQAWAIRRAAR
jgi:para-nitrobenzyl esterase